MTSVKEETIRNVKWSAMEKFSLQIMQFVLGLIMARLLTPEDYGTVGMISIFLAISTSFIDSGFGTALIRKKEVSTIDYSTVFYFNILVALLCYGILFFVAPFIAIFFSTPILCSILRIQSINLLLNALMQIQVAKLTRELNFKALAKRSIFASLISGICGICFAYNGYGVWSLVYQGLISSFINLLFIWRYSNWRPRLIFSKHSFNELFGFGSKLMLSGLINTIYANMTTFVVGRFCSARDLGFYNRGVQFAKIPVDTINNVFMKVTFPILVKFQDDDKRLISVYRKYISFFSILVFFGCMFLVSIARPLILFLLTEKWLSSVIFLQVYAFSIMFNHINTLNLNLLQVKGRSDLFLKLEVIKKTIFTFILFVSIPFGAIGICVSKILCTQIAIVINTYYTGKLFGLGYFSQIKDFSIFFVASLFACFPTFLLNIFENNPYVGLFVGLITAPLLYCIILRNNPHLRELFQLIREKIKK